MVSMTGMDAATRHRVGELAACPLERHVADEIRAVLTSALRRPPASKSGGTRARSRRTPRKEQK